MPGETREGAGSVSAEFQCSSEMCVSVVVVVCAVALTTLVPGRYTPAEKSGKAGSRRSSPSKL